MLLRLSSDFFDITLSTFLIDEVSMFYILGVEINQAKWGTRARYRDIILGEFD